MFDFFYIYNMNENIIKLQKHNSFININGDNGQCTVCNKVDNINTHFCMELIEENNETFTNLNDFKNDMVELNDGQINYINTLFKQQKQKYINNSFFKSIVNQANTNKKLTKSQYNQLIYLLQKGRTMYEDGILSTKN